MKWFLGVASAVLATVVGGWILQATTGIEVWAGVVSAAAAVLGFVTQPLTVRAWALPVIAVSGLSLSLVARSLYRRQHLGPDWLRYTRDRILDVDWQWEYWGRTKPLPKEPTPLCPKCHFEMQFFAASAYAAVGYAGLACSNCGHELRYELQRHQVLDRVRKHIEHRIRTGVAAA